MRKFAAALLLGACLAVPSLADDGTAELGVGGLVFTKSADIRMAKEDLYVSPEKVKIRFEFQNTGKDQDIVIAFPLPDINLEDLQGEAYGTIGKDPVNFVGFTTTVDGKRVTTQVEQKAIFKGKDVSALIRAAGLPLNLASNDGTSLLQKLPSAKRAPLVKAGLIDGDNEYPAPLWTVQTRFYWTQHFGAGKTLVITHAYTPVSGGLQYSQGIEGRGPDPELLKLYCIDPSIAKRLKAMSDNPKLRAPDENNSPGGILWGWTTDYILWSANTWKGPIGHFHLTLDKLDARSVLTLCWTGLKKTSPTTFEFTADNFAPTHDIKMLVLR